MLQSTQNNYIVVRNQELSHTGIKGMRWGIRRYQNEDGSLTPEGADRYLKLRRKNNGRTSSARKYTRYVSKLRRNENFRNNLSDWDKFNSLLDKARDFETAKKGNGEKILKDYKEFIDSVRQKAGLQIPKDYKKSKEFIDTIIKDNVNSLNFEQVEIAQASGKRFVDYAYDTLSQTPSIIIYELTPTAYNKYVLK